MTRRRSFRRRLGKNLPKAPVSQSAALIVVPDVNVLVSAQNANRAGRTDTTSQRVLRYLTTGYVHEPPIQLVVSFKMIDTYREVLKRRGIDDDVVEMAAGALIEIMKNGPRTLDPYIVFGGTPDPAILDVEDGSVLATAFAAKADVLITDNLADFAVGDCQTYNTSVVARPDGSTRQLSCQIHRRPNGQSLIVVHPADFAHWIERRFDISQPSIESTFERQTKPKKATEKK
jgi:predicted nucleic acid-binding protein